MTGLLIVAAALVLAMLGSELALRGTKLQTGLSRVLLVWGSVFVLTIYPLFRYGDTGAIILLMFWGGAFLSWFGVRSHIESSILLRMVYLLRQQPMSDADLVAKYGAHYGQAMRLEELYRGGLAVKDGDRSSVTAKGKNILRVVAQLRSGSAKAEPEVTS
jgi:hypothetical protein